VTHYPFPDPAFNPLTAQPEELDQYGLPRRPDSVKQPALLKAWPRLFKQPLTFVPPQVKRPPSLVPQPPINSVRLSAGRFETSENWSGASIVPNDGHQFVQIFGEWKVPEPSLPPMADSPKPGATYSCATWIGLDGARRYLDSSLPQIGTRQTVTVQPDGSPCPEYTAWIQWWQRGPKAEPNLQYIRADCIRVQCGTSVMAMVWAIHPSCVVRVLRNFDPDNHITIIVSEAPKVPDGLLRISGATAEWIVERPSPLRDDYNPVTGYRFDPFARYDGVQFEHCVAGTARGAGPSTSELTLQGPRLLRMFEVPPESPPRTRFISMPKRISATSVHVDYGGFRE
jgi:Peptidase A4 family